MNTYKVGFYDMATYANPKEWTKIVQAMTAEDAITIAKINHRFQDEARLRIVSIEALEECRS